MRVDLLLYKIIIGVIDRYPTQNIFHEMARIFREKDLVSLFKQFENIIVQR
jgi:hypothetical protein